MSSINDELRRERAAEWQRVPPEMRLIMSLRMGRIQLAAFAHAHGLGLDAAAALLRRQVQETRRYSACLRDVGADG